MSNDHVHPIFQPILAGIAPAACTSLEDGRPCGDEGELCEGCSERTAAEWSWLRHAPKYAVMPADEEYYAELRDAGRLK